MKEHVKVSLVQVEVTVWPKDGASDACLGLGKDDFELTVGGRSRPIYSVDAVGDEEIPTSPDAPARGGMSVVLLFDLYHLDLFYKRAHACPHGLALAFREARRYVEEEFRDGDRLLLVTYGAWPIVHEGWIRTRAEGLRALERLEKNDHALRGVGRGHLHHARWIAGLQSFFLAMGRYPGRKDVIWLVEDFSHDDVAMRVFQLAGRAQSSGVVMSAPDLLDSCRSIPVIPPCPPPDCVGAACRCGGGLGGTMWAYPVGVSLAAETGGNVFPDESIARGVAVLRAQRKCRYLVSFEMPPAQGRRQQRMHLGLKEGHHDLSLTAPSAYQAPTWEASVVEKEEALFLLPRFGRGLAAEATIWPYRLAAGSKKKKKRPKWDAFALARLEHTKDEVWPDELKEITVYALLHSESKVHGSYQMKIAGQELTALRPPGASRLLLFPFHDVPPGDTTLDLTVTSNVPGIAANTRKDQTIPLPPDPGKAEAWFLSDHLVRLADRAVMAPSLDDSLAPGEPAWMVGFTCGRRAALASYQGSLVSSSGSTTVPVTLNWLPDSDGNARACGWLFGSVAADLAPDVWRFDPPTALQPEVKGPPVEFTVGTPGEKSSSP
ncbi:MAG TPA: hypothetical protein VFV75_09490 [Candidatus Polarisedimenticolaceae bacterium]|nr:hypothetical protein [Candidatus Polarisedimenticolaceae bacterium]